MPVQIRRLALIALLVGFSGCGGESNNPAPNAATPDYGQETKDKMASMYGPPKVEKPVSNNPADMIRQTYQKK